MLRLYWSSITYVNEVLSFMKRNLVFVQYQSSTDKSDGSRVTRGGNMSIVKPLSGIVCAVVLGMGTAYAQNAGESADEPMMPGERSTTVERGTTTSEEDLRTVTVTVESVDPKQNKVTFEAAVQPEANITSDGQPIRLQQLQEGDQVRASFDPMTGELIKAQVIKKESGASKKQ